MLARAVSGQLVLVFGSELFHCSTVNSCQRAIEILRYEVLHKHQMVKQNCSFRVVAEAHRELLESYFLTLLAGLWALESSAPFRSRFIVPQ
jgi:hypothetical protein